MNDPYELFDLINEVTDELGLDGFDLWFAELDDETKAAVTAALADPAFTLEAYQRIPGLNAAWRDWYEGKRANPKNTWAKDLTDCPEWRVWFLRMGRGAGKTRAAACAVHVLARDVFPGGSGILVGTKHADVRDTMIRGSSGLLATASPGFEPRFNQHDNTLFWPNGSSAIIRTADNPEDLRGYTVNWAWADELVKWRSAATWDNLDRCVREEHPNGTKIILTTTPKRGKEWIKAIEADSQTITTVATSLDNPHQDRSALEKRAREQAMGGLKAQEEVNGEWAKGDERLWTAEMIDGWRKTVKADLKSVCNSMDRTLLSVDPSKGIGQDETGIILFGQKGKKAVCLADFTSGSSFETWTDRVVELAKSYLRPNDTILVEQNNFHGIDSLLREKCRKQGVTVRISTETSVNSKWYRAQEAFSHCVAGDVEFYGSDFQKLEQQLCDWDPEQKDSPDRGDAFAQGVNEIMGSRGRGLRAAFNAVGLNL